MRGFVYSYLSYLNTGEKHKHRSIALTYLHPFGPSVGIDTRAAFGDGEVSPSAHPELLFKLLALLPKVQLTIVSCVPSKSCSSSSSSSSFSRWLGEAELPLLLYCNQNEQERDINKHVILI